MGNNSFAYINIPLVYFRTFLVVLYAALLNSCQENDLISSKDRKILTIIYTNDEHGWMQPSNPKYGGATNMKGRWILKERKNESMDLLILSGGDMWSGPDISSYFKGESMVEVMNSMGYSAAALGNHEFDFKVENLIKNSTKMSFPLLSANIIDKGTGKIPTFVEPYTIKSIGGVDVGIIGLSSLSTPQTTISSYVKDFEFTDYGKAIDFYAPLLLNIGIDVLVVIGHLCESEMESLIPYAKKYNISMIGGGHCHEAVNKIVDGVALVQSSSHLTAYGRVKIEFFPYTKKTNVLSNYMVVNNKGYTDLSLSRIISFWEEEILTKSDIKIGYCSKSISKTSIEMRKLISDSWFFKFQFADYVLFHSNDIRKDLSKGYITSQMIKKILPDDNLIYKLDLTGSELKEIAKKSPYGGLDLFNMAGRLDGTNEIHDDHTYIVLATDGFYHKESNKLRIYDPNPQFTSTHYRQPLIDWIKCLNTDAKRPLNGYLNNIFEK